MCIFVAYIWNLREAFRSEREIYTQTSNLITMNFKFVSINFCVFLLHGVCAYQDRKYGYFFVIANSIKYTTNVQWLPFLT